MKSANKLLTDAEAYRQARAEDRLNAGLCLAFFLFVFAAMLFAVVGCASPVVPDAVPAAPQASFDGNDQNSGVIRSTASGFVVTDQFRERLNALVATYGGDFSPPLKPDHGLAPMGGGHHLITKEAMVHFLEMNAWRRAGLKPQN